MGENGKRRRDPERRKQEIVDAAAELVIEIGAASLTHRLVATRARVPLGSTTQYFATLDDLRNAALARLADDVQSFVDQVATTLEEAADLGDAVQEISRGLHEYLSDPHLVRADAMLSAAAAVDPQVRVLTDAWIGGLTAVLTPRLGAAAAQCVTIFISGTVWHAALNDAPPALDTIQAALHALFRAESADEALRSTTAHAVVHDEERPR